MVKTKKQNGGHKDKPFEPTPQKLHFEEQHQKKSGWFGTPNLKNQAKIQLNSRIYGDTGGLRKLAQHTTKYEANQAALSKLQGEQEKRSSASATTTSIGQKLGDFFKGTVNVRVAKAQAQVNARKKKIEAATAPHLKNNVFGAILKGVQEVSKQGKPVNLEESSQEKSSAELRTKVNKNAHENFTAKLQSLAQLKQLKKNQFNAEQTRQFHQSRSEEGLIARQRVLNSLANSQKNLTETYKEKDKSYGVTGWSKLNPMEQYRQRKQYQIAKSTAKQNLTTQAAELAKNNFFAVKPTLVSNIEKASTQGFFARRRIEKQAKENQKLALQMPAENAKNILGLVETQQSKSPSLMINTEKEKARILSEGIRTASDPKALIAAAKTQQLYNQTFGPESKSPNRLSQTQKTYYEALSQRPNLSKADIEREIAGLDSKSSENGVKKLSSSEKKILTNSLIAQQEKNKLALSFSKPKEESEQAQQAQQESKATIREASYLASQLGYKEEPVYGDGTLRGKKLGSVAYAEAQSSSNDEPVYGDGSANLGSIENPFKEGQNIKPFLPLSRSESTTNDPPPYNTKEVINPFGAQTALTPTAPPLGDTVELARARAEREEAALKQTQTAPTKTIIGDPLAIASAERAARVARAEREAAARTQTPTAPTPTPRSTNLEAAERNLQKSLTYRAQVAAKTQAKINTARKEGNLGLASELLKKQTDEEIKRFESQTKWEAEVAHFKEQEAAALKQTQALSPLEQVEEQERAYLARVEAQIKNPLFAPPGAQQFAPGAQQFANKTMSTSYLTRRGYQQFTNTEPGLPKTYKPPLTELGNPGGSTHPANIPSAYKESVEAAQAKRRIQIQESQIQAQPRTRQPQPALSDHLNKELKVAEDNLQASLEKTIRVTAEAQTEIDEINKKLKLLKPEDEDEKLNLTLKRNELVTKKKTLVADRLKAENIRKAEVEQFKSMLADPVSLAKQFQAESLKKHAEIAAQTKREIDEVNLEIAQSINKDPAIYENAQKKLAALVRRETKEQENAESRRQFREGQVLEEEEKQKAAALLRPETIYGSGSEIASAGANRAAPIKPFVPTPLYPGDDPSSIPSIFNPRLSTERRSYPSFTGGSRTKKRSNTKKRTNTKKRSNTKKRTYKKKINKSKKYKN